MSEIVLSSLPSPICLSFGPERHLAARARLGLVGLEEHLHRHVAGRDRLGRGLLVRLDAEELVGVVEQAVLVDPQREAADEVGEGDEDALGAAVGHVDVGLDRVRPADDPRDHRRLDTFWTSPAYSNRVTVGIGGSMPKKTAKPPSSGSTRLRSASCQKRSFSSASFVRVLGREVVRLAEVVGQVVELPLVLLGVPRPAGRELLQRRG